MWTTALSRIDQWRFIEGAVDALRQLQAAGFELIIVSNQSGIARGFYTAEDVELLHGFVTQSLTAAGVTLGAIVYCPHGAEEGCDCRKPKTGLAQTASQLLGHRWDYGECWTIGDKGTDIEFGAALGTRTALLTSRYWQREALSITPTRLVDSLREAAASILRTGHS